LPGHQSAPSSERIAKNSSTCWGRAATAKNRKEAQQFIQHDLAEQLRAYDSRKLPSAAVFNLPHKSDMARMIREDLADARREWLRECLGDLETYVRREQTDFLAEVNHAGEVFDFLLPSPHLRGLARNEGRFPQGRPARNAPFDDNAYVRRLRPSIPQSGV
jgi:hypothetical protein